MDFVALERSSHAPFGFPLNTCVVCLQKPLPCPFGCLKWPIPEVFDPCGFGCVLGRGFLSLLWFLAPGSELLFPQILTHFPQREMLAPLPFHHGSCSAVADAGSMQDHCIFSIFMGSQVCWDTPRDVLLLHSIPNCQGSS